MKNDFRKQSDVQMRTHLSIVLSQIINLSFSVPVHALVFFASSRTDGESKLFQSRNFYCLIFCCGICFRLTLDLIEHQRRRCQVKLVSERGKAGVKGEKRSAGD